MSKAWGRGSTRRWRKLRARVLDRDGWTCQIDGCSQPINPGLKPPHPRSATVHHKLGKRYGDDPQHLVAAHRDCNQALGDPTAHDPPPQPRTRW